MGCKFVEFLLGRFCKVGSWMNMSWAWVWDESLLDLSCIKYRFEKWSLISETILLLPICIVAKHYFLTQGGTVGWANYASVSSDQVLI